jgi:hypothetical protein
MWEVAKGLDTIEDQRVKANLMAATAVFAGLVMEPEMIKTILRSDMMKESAFYKEILQEGRLEGRLEGEREGKLKVGQQLLRLGMSLSQVAQVTAIPNSNGNIKYRRYLAFMRSREISLISDVFCTSSSNLSLLESQQPANKLDQSLNRALR